MVKEQPVDRLVDRLKQLLGTAPSRCKPRASSRTDSFGVMIRLRSFPQ
jgi:hypothetical protein